MACKRSGVRLPLAPHFRRSKAGCDLRKLSLSACNPASACSRRRVPSYPDGPNRDGHHHGHVPFPSHRPSPCSAISAANGQWVVRRFGAHLECSCRLARTGRLGTVRVAAPGPVRARKNPGRFPGRYWPVLRRRRLVRARRYSEQLGRGPTGEHSMIWGRHFWSFRTVRALSGGLLDGSGNGMTGNGGACVDTCRRVRACLLGRRVPDGSSTADGRDGQGARPANGPVHSEQPPVERHARRGTGRQYRESLSAYCPGGTRLLRRQCVGGRGRSAAWRYVPVR
jgi:hypothetical protein